MEEPPTSDLTNFRSAMRLLRRRRKYFFATIIGYMPAMWLANKISPTFRSMAIAFGIWVVILFITALYSAIARCPRCGQYFHMHGMSLLYLRHCLHCQLHVNANRAENLNKETDSHYKTDIQVPFKKES